MVGFRRRSITPTIATVAELLRKYWPTSAAVYLPGDKVPATGTLFTNVTLADTYAPSRLLAFCSVQAKLVAHDHDDYSVRDAE